MAFKAHLSDDRISKQLEIWRAREKEIVEGSLPYLHERFSGHALNACNLTVDIRAWARHQLLSLQGAGGGEDATPVGAVRAVFEQLLHDQSEKVLRALAALNISSEQTKTIDYYLSMLGEEEAIDRTVINILNGISGWNVSAADRLNALALILGFVSSDRAVLNDVTAGRTPVDLVAVGQIKINDIVRTIEVSGRQKDDQEISTAAKASDLAKLLADVSANVDAEPAGICVIAKLGIEPVSLDRKAVYRSFASVAGVGLPTIDRGDVHAHRTALARRWPHAAGIVATVLGDLAPRERIRLRPTILVGRPGSGKSQFTRDLCGQLGLPFTVYNAGGMADASIGGTSAQWNTARPSVPLDLIRSSGKANPCVIVDELEKASDSRMNGSMFDALLGLLDRGTAARSRDLCLEVEVDLSHVNWLMTANSLDGIPKPLFDRCRVVEMPKPEWKHTGDLAKSIISEIARDRDIDERWIEPLAGDELELMRKTWRGGSLRRLKTIVETIVVGRDAVMGRA